MDSCWFSWLVWHFWRALCPPSFWSSKLKISQLLVTGKQCDKAATAKKSARFTPTFSLQLYLAKCCLHVNTCKCVQLSANCWLLFTVKSSTTKTRHDCCCCCCCCTTANEPQRGGAAVLDAQAETRLGLKYSVFSVCNKSDKLCGSQHLYCSAKSGVAYAHGIRKYRFLKRPFSLACTSLRRRDMLLSYEQSIKRFVWALIVWRQVSTSCTSLGVTIGIRGFSENFRLHNLTYGSFFVFYFADCVDLNVWDNMTKEMCHR